MIVRTLSNALTRKKATLQLKTILTAVLACTAFAASATAASVTGEVINGTSNKPAAGADVSLLSLSQGMMEIGHTKTDASGKYSIDVPNDGTPHMVKVEHQGVSYFPKGGPIMPGATTAATVKVYDVEKKLSVSTTVNVMRVQSDGTTLQATELYAVQNASNPPKTMFDSDNTYEITLPEGAVIDSSAARTQDGQPVNSEPSKLKDKNHYAFVFPLRPGETQFQISWHLPYKGSASLTPKPVTAMQHFVVMFPKSMKFEATRASAYSPMNDETGSGIQVASDVKPGADLSFKISGTGQIAEAAQGGSGGPPQGGGQMSAARQGPGGGLGPPIEAPDPMEKSRIPILIVIVIAMLGAAFIVTKRNGPKAAVVEGDEDEVNVAAPPKMPANVPKAPAKVAVSPAVPAASPAVAPPARAAAPVAAAAPADHASMLLDVMKEELFQLELDRAQGKLSEAEYQKAKGALDETFKRALTRKSQTSA